jgi:hypothetical protein
MVNRSKFMKKVLALLAMAAIISVCSLSSASAESKQADILRMMEISGELQMTRQAMTRVLDQMKNSGRKVPDAYWGEFKSALDTDELPNLLVAVYDKHYSHEEILALIEFYKSPIGQVLIKKQPLVQSDSMGVGQQWASSTSAEIMKRILPMRDDAGAAAPTE